MLRVNVAFLPGAPVPDTAVVIDVLRMTTTATVLFARGLADLRIVAGEDEAREEARAAGALLLGERHGVKLPGFDHGNSPLEYAAMDLSGRRAVLCTTNGSKAVEASSGARHLLLGAIVNDAAVARRALELAETEVTLVCSGTEGRLSLEDVLGAACIIERIMDLREDVELTDAARVALLTKAGAGPLEAAVRQARHAATLEGLGFGADIGFAAGRGALDQVAERTGVSPARFEGRG